MQILVAENMLELGKLEGALTAAKSAQDVLQKAGAFASPHVTKVYSFPPYALACALAYSTLSLWSRCLGHTLISLHAYLPSITTCSGEAAGGKGGDRPQPALQRFI